MDTPLLSPAPVDLTGNLAWDTQALDRLRHQATKDPKAALRQVAGQFEALLVNEMLKTARDARLDGNADAGGQGVYTQMFDEQMAQTLTKGHGFGLADLLTRQLERRYYPAPAAVAPVGGRPQPAAPIDSIAAPPAQ